MKIHRVDLGIYPVVFNFTTCKNSFHVDTGEEIEEGADGCVYTDDGKTTNVWMYIEKFDIQTIVHECFHAAIATAKIVGIVLDYDNDEPLAYLADWFAGKVLEFMELDNKKVILRER
jgi:hypothetical protein